MGDGDRVGGPDGVKGGRVTQKDGENNLPSVLL